MARRRVQCPLRVILVRRRRAEGGHYGVADELLDRPARSLNLVSHGVVEAVEQDTGALRILRPRMAVDPTRSAKSTVASLRSSPVATASTGAAHAEQKCAPGRNRGATVHTSQRCHKLRL